MAIILRKPDKPKEVTPDECLDQQQVARLLGVSCKTLQRWRNSGEGPLVVRDGVTPLYPIAELRSWILPAYTRMLKAG